LGRRVQGQRRGQSPSPGPNTSRRLSWGDRANGFWLADAFVDGFVLVLDSGDIAEGVAELVVAEEADGEGEEEGRKAGALDDVIPADAELLIKRLCRG